MSNPFPDTSWSLIDRAGSPGHDGVAAKRKFQERYGPAVSAYVLAMTRGTALDGAQVTQDFFVDQVWMGRVLSSASQDYARFRYFLKRCVRNYVMSCLRAVKPVQRLDTAAEGRLVGSDGLEPEYAFELERARGLMQQAIDDVEEQCRNDAEAYRFEVFRRRFLPEGPATPSWTEVGKSVPFPDGVADVDHRTARNLAETVSARVRKALLERLTRQTGSRERALDELELIAGILNAQ